jgi:hypothetical protein
MKKDFSDKPNGNALLIRHELQRLEKRQEKLRKEIWDIRLRLENECIHDDVKKTEKCYDGGYDYTGWCEYMTICNVCGKTLSKNTVSSGSYG